MTLGELKKGLSKYKDEFQDRLMLGKGQKFTLGPKKQPFEVVDIFNDWYGDDGWIKRHIFTTEGVYYQYSAYYNSWEGYMWDDIDEITKVEKKEKLVTVWEKV